MAKGIHLFPYRTQKLSLSAPMVLGWRRPGRVGRCRIPKKKLSLMAGLFLCAPGIFLPGHLQPSATLYLARFPIARRRWRKRARWETPGRVGRCWIPKKKLSLMAGLFLCPPGFFSRAVFSQVQHCTWLGFQPCAPSGTEACRRQWRKQAGGASGIAKSGQRAATMRVPRGKRARWETPAGNLTRSCGAQQIRKRSRQINALY